MAKTIVVDVDGTLCYTNNAVPYADRAPRGEVLAKVRRLYSEGWRVVLHTSRGMLSREGDAQRIDSEVRPVLEEWLVRHRVPYHELVMCKPYGDIYLDDKAMRPEELVLAEV